MASGCSIAYTDFAVRIAPDGPGYASEVVFAPAGAGSRAPFVLPFAQAEIPALLSDLQRSIHGDPRGRSRHLEAPARSSSRRHDPAEVGTRLFRALFQGDVGLAFARSRPRPGDPRLRIRLLVNPLRKECAAIAALPWELLGDPDGEGFLSPRSRFAVVRYLEGTDAHAPLPLTGDLRVLAAFSLPGDLPRLEATAERTALERWGAIPGVRVTVLEHASFDEVRDRLHGEVFHVFHFSGHGGFAGGRGTLAFERAGGTEAIGAELLTATFEEAPALRLAVINACDSGKAPRLPGVDPYRGVATALIRSAVPAVVGMQFPISDRAAARFAKTLYASLAQGDPIDAAVTRGRLEILRDRDSLEWATPALHLRVPDGRLFERTEPPPVRPPAEPEAARSEPLVASEPAPRAHPLRALAATAALALLAALAWGGWRATRSRPEGVQPIASGVPDAVPPAGAASPPGARVAAAWECPPHPLLPGFQWMVIERGALELPPEEPGGEDRMLVVPTALCIGRFETTWKDLRSVLGEEELPEEDPSPDDRLPAYRVTWELAQKFLDRLNSGDPDRPYRLPTAEEWEYSARAGSPADFSFGDDPIDLPDHGNCRSSGPRNDGYDHDPAPVGSYRPNEFGLFDMHGNVWEWVGDPPGSDHGPGYRIRCGGSFDTVARTCTASCASTVQGDRGYRDTGFRIVRELAPAAPDDRP